MTSSDMSVLDKSVQLNGVSFDAAVVLVSL